MLKSFSSRKLKSDKNIEINNPAKNARNTALIFNKTLFNQNKTGRIKKGKQMDIFSNPIAEFLVYSIPINNSKYKTIKQPIDLELFSAFKKLALEYPPKNKYNKENKNHNTNA